MLVSDTCASDGCYNVVAKEGVILIAQVIGFHFRQILVVQVDCLFFKGQISASRARNKDTLKGDISMLFAKHIIRWHSRFVQSVLGGIPQNSVHGLGTYKVRILYFI